MLQRIRTQLPEQTLNPLDRPIARTVVLHGFVENDLDACSLPTLSLHTPLFDGLELQTPGDRHPLHARALPTKFPYGP